MKSFKVNCIITSTLLSLIFLSKISFGQWTIQQIAPNFIIYDVRFIDKYTGWVCGDDRIFKTTNGGTNWIEQANPAQSIIFQIFPVNENVVYSAGYCTILKTTNGGDNWLPIRIGSLPCSELPLLRGLWFINQDTGWFCSDRGYVLRTLDGCNSFDSIPVDDALYDIHFKNFTTGIASSGGRTFRTTSSGLNWYEIPLPHGPAIPDNYTVTFVGDTGWTAGSTNSVYKTTNYGISWDSISYIPNLHSDTRSVEFSSSMTGYIGCYGRKIFKSTNGGFNWINMLTENYGPATYSSIYAFDDNTVWAGGGYGFILHTTNGGGLILGINESNIEIPKVYKLFQNYPNPFNPMTDISYQLPFMGHTLLKIYNVLGTEVATLVNEIQIAGIYKYQFSTANYKLSSGTYFYQMKVNGQILSTKKMLHIK
ncbi:MAG: YCF48-related protein [Ignavibacteria bacterium]